MKKILILCSIYGSEKSANGICAKNIASELKNNGNQVYVISNSGTDENKELDLSEATVYAVRQSWFSKISKKFESNKSMVEKLIYKMTSLLRHIFLIPFYPNVSPLRSRRVYRLSKKIVEEYGIDTIIATYRPYESIYAALKLKKKYGDALKVIDYHLDVLTDSNTSSSFARKFQYARACKVVEKERAILDKLILPESIRSRVENISNIKFTDFPVYVPNQIEESCDFQFDSNAYNIAYVGTLNVENRNPRYVVSFLNKINEKSEQPFVLHIWGNVSKEILDYLKNSKYIKYHGLVEHQYVMNLLKRADLLLNITNKNTINMLPSKIFQLFAAQKPILNFVKNRNDCSLPYLKKSGVTFNIYEDTEISEQEFGVLQFIDGIDRSNIKVNEELLYKCTPKYLIDIIEGI